MLFRVSEVESFRQWREDEDADVDALIARMRGGIPPSPAMLAGTAFHRALELAQPGEVQALEADGYRFEFKCEAQIELPAIRELRGSRRYGGIEVTGCVDAIDGHRIDDHKTTGSFDPDRYLAGFQWRLYLDIFGAGRFRWNVFRLKEGDEPGLYYVTEVHRLEQCRYPGMHDDCARLAADMEQFALQYLPERRRVA